MQLIININDSVADKVLYILENLKNDVEIIKKEPLDFDQISEEQIKKLKQLSQDYKNGNKEEFVEYKI